MLINGCSAIQRWSMIQRAQTSDSWNIFDPYPVQGASENESAQLTTALAELVRQP